MFPACGSVGPPVCCCQRPWSFCVTRPSSPYGSPFRARLGAALSVAARRVGALAARERVEELRQLRLVLAADGGDAERRERDEVAVELADPVDQPVAAGVADQDVEAGAAVDAVLVARVRVGHVVQPRVAVLQAVAVVAVADAAGGRSSSAFMRSLPQPPQACRVPVPPTSQSLPRSPKIDVVAVAARRRPAWSVQVPFGCRTTTQPGGVVRPSFAVEVEEVLARRRSGPPVSVQVWPLFENAVQLHDVPSALNRIVAARVVLVVEQELAEPARDVVVRVPRVRVGAEVEDVARVPRVVRSRSRRGRSRS